MNRAKLKKAVLLSFLVSLAVIVLYLAGFFEKLGYMVYDGTVRIVRSDRRPSEDVAIVLIDEASLRALDPIVGRWPWPRAIYSDLLEFFSIARPRAVLFDILFTEYQEITDSGALGPDDSRFAEATEGAGFVYHAFQLLRDSEDEVNRSLLNRPLPVDFAERFGLKKVINGDGIKKGNNNYYLPFTELYRAAAGMGVVEYSPDSDGAFRRTKLIREYLGSYFPVMGLAPLVDADTAVKIDRRHITIGDRRMPVDEDATYMLNFYPYETYNTYSISGIFSSLQKISEGEVEDIMVDPTEFENRIVFIGASAVGLQDLKNTPVHPRTPGVYLHATLASNYIQQDFLVPPDRGVTVIAIVLFVLLCMGGVLYLERLVLKIGLPFILLICWISFFLFMFRHNVVYEAVPPSVAILLSSMVSFGYLFVTEGREKLRVKKMFSQYVSPEVLTILTEKPDEYASIEAGSIVDLTVFFCDIRGFTSFSDRNPPEKVVELLNRFFSEMSDVIFNHKGTIDKYIGDAIMAFWGAPVKIDDHADQAVLAALEMARRVGPFNEELKERGFDFELKIGIGINSGRAVLGNIGSTRKMNFTIIGDTVNLASRLEGLNKTYGCPVIISEFTFNRLSRRIPCRIVDSVRVRGKEGTIRVYEPLLAADEDELAGLEKVCEVTNRAFELFQRQEFDAALELYSRLDDCRLKQVFMERCRRCTEESE